MNTFADRIIDTARKNRSRVIVGLDPNLSQFPEYLQSQLRGEPTDDMLCETVFAFNRVIIESTQD
jgi:hypothetical protein